jgi:hypothetical protein
MQESSCVEQELSSRNSVKQTRGYDTGYLDLIYAFSNASKYRAANGTFSGPLYQFTLAILPKCQNTYTNLPICQLAVAILPICQCHFAILPICHFHCTNLPFCHCHFAGLPVHVASLPICLILPFCQFAMHTSFDRLPCRTVRVTLTASTMPTADIKSSSAATRGPHFCIAAG